MIPDGEQTANDVIRQFHNKITRIKKIIHYPKYNKDTYTLEHCHSAFGNDYEFLGDWLIPIDIDESEVLA